MQMLSKIGHNRSLPPILIAVKMKHNSIFLMITWYTGWRSGVTVNEVGLIAESN